MSPNFIYLAVGFLGIFILYCLAQLLTAMAFSSFNLAALAIDRCCVVALGNGFGFDFFTLHYSAFPQGFRHVFRQSLGVGQVVSVQSGEPSGIAHR